MKKTILAMLLVGSSCAVFAQNDSLNRNTGNNGSTNQTGTNGTNMSRNATGTTDQSRNTMGTTGQTGTNNNLSNSGTYNAYGTFTATPPDYMSGYISRDYPMASDIRWQQNADWWHGYYMYNDMPTHLYYNTAGQNFTVALPVHQTLIPDAVVTKANQLWGPTLYDITMIKGSQGQDVYHIRTIENGTVSDQWVDENGNKVIDVFRVDDVNTNGNNGYNTNQTGTGMNQSGSNMNQGGNNNQSGTNMNQNGSNMNQSGSNMNQSGSNMNQSGNTMNESGTNMNQGSTDMNTTSGMDNNAQMNNTGSGKMKLKTETSDGKEIKTKIKDGKVVKQKKS